MTPDAPTTTAGPYWEPWCPKVGDRVRVRISPECEVHAERLAYTVGYDPHGRVGTVTADYRVPNPLLTGPVPALREQSNCSKRQGHWWRVEFAEPIGTSIHGWAIDADGLCAAELEPLDPEPRP